MNVNSRPKGRFDGLLERTRKVWYSAGFAVSILVLALMVISHTDISSIVAPLALPFLLLSVEMTTRRLGLRHPWRWLALACYAVCALVIVAILALVDFTGYDVGYRIAMIAWMPLLVVLVLCMLIVLAVRSTRAERIAAPILLLLLPAALILLAPANFGSFSVSLSLIDAVFVLAYLWVSFRVLWPAGEGQVMLVSKPGARAA